MLCPPPIDDEVEQGDKEQAHHRPSRHADDDGHGKGKLQGRAHVPLGQEGHQGKDGSQRGHDDRLQPALPGKDDGTQEGVSASVQVIDGIHLQDRVVDDNATHDNQPDH